LAARYNFDQRDRFIAALKKVDKASLIAVYQKMLVNKHCVNLLIQLQGTASANKAFAKP